MKYLIYAMKADEEGKPNIVRLFKAIAFTEQVHATNHLKKLGDVSITVDNLQSAVDGENFEVEVMYPAYDVVAKLQDEKNAIRSVHYAIEAEKIHAVMYREAKQSVKSGRDAELGDIYICPVCGISKDKFVTF